MISSGCSGRFGFASLPCCAPVRAAVRMSLSTRLLPVIIPYTTVADETVIIKSIIWLPRTVEKLEAKHGVTVEEVEEVFALRPIYRRGPRGKRRSENLYKAYGQTKTGRYLFVVFIYKLNRRALILSARDMTDKEQRLNRKN
ncbi:MAG: BrnT family toxin [Methyloligellaceae bacterium]